jgi:hypothetical protein
MRFSMSKILFALALAHGAGNALACPPQQAWGEHSALSFDTGGAGQYAVTRFSDGVYARMEDEDGLKEMYQLDRGATRGVTLYMHKGLTVAELSGPLPFFKLYARVGKVLNLLAVAFPDPCAVTAVATPFSFVLPSGRASLDVSGNAHRLGESALVFDFTGV